MFDMYDEIETIKTNFPDQKSIPPDSDLYVLDYDDDEKFIDEYFRCLSDSRYCKPRKFRPEDTDRAKNLIEKTIEEQAGVFEIDPTIAKTVVATAINEKRKKLTFEQEQSPYDNESLKDQLEFIDNLNPVSLNCLVYNALFGCYVSKVTGRNMMFEFDRDQVTCIFMSTGGLRLMSLTFLNTYSLPKNLNLTLRVVTGVGHSREIVFKGEEITRRFPTFDFKSIFELSEENMDLTGKNVQEIIIENLKRIKYSFTSILELEQYMKDMNYYYEKPTVYETDHETGLPLQVEMTVELCCLQSIYSYLGDIFPAKYGISTDLCYMGNENSFVYESFADRTITSAPKGKYIEISPYVRKSFDEPDFPDVRFKFGLIGDIFEIFVSGLTLRTNSLRGLETLIRFDYDSLFTSIESILSKAVLNKKNIDNILDLEEL